MARKPSAAEPKPANLSFDQMREAIPKIERRIGELEAFDPKTINDRDDPRIQALANKLDALLIAIFGPDTIEYKRYQYPVTNIDTAGYNVAYGTALDEVRKGLTKGKQTALHQLRDLISQFQEEMGDSGVTPIGRALKAYEGLDLHPSIGRSASQLYKNGHYANAIEDAVKALNSLVRLNSGIDDRDGTALMEFVFSAKNPILKFNPLADQSDIDEQRGFMMMFSGAVAGLRNPRAHKIIKDDPESALALFANHVVA